MVGSGECSEGAKGQSAPVYTVDVYDPSRDAARDLERTIDRAGRENKRILLLVGGNWCGWCRTLSKYLAENEAIATALANDFLIMKVNYSGENTNEKFLDRFLGIPAYPHFFVLESDGKLLRSQDGEDFESGRSYDGEKFLAFLSKWRPRPD